MIVHFICRGNAFRSIIAEAYLNSLAIPGVKTISSGTVADAHRSLNKDLFQNTLGILEKHGIRQFAKDHYGDQLDPTSIEGNDNVICLGNDVAQEAEQIVELPNNVTTWDVADVDVGDTRTAFTHTELDAFAEAVYQNIVSHIDQISSNLGAKS